MRRLLSAGGKRGGLYGITDRRKDHGKRKKGKEMKLKEAIEFADWVKPNGFTEEQKNERGNRRRKIRRKI